MNIVEDKEQIEILKKELSELKSNMEREQKEIEHTYKVEISDIEDCYNEEKKLLQEKFQAEKVTTHRKNIHIVSSNYVMFLFCFVLIIAIKMPPLSYTNPTYVGYLSIIVWVII